MWGVTPSRENITLGNLSPRITLPKHPTCHQPQGRAAPPQTHTSSRPRNLTTAACWSFSTSTNQNKKNIITLTICIEFCPAVTGSHLTTSSPRPFCPSTRPAATPQGRAAPLQSQCLAVLQHAAQHSTQQQAATLECYYANRLLLHRRFS